MASLPDSEPIPVVEGIRRSFSGVTGLALLGAGAWCGVTLLRAGPAAFSLAAYLPWSDAAPPRSTFPFALPSLLALPLLFVAHVHARRGRVVRSGRWFLWSLGVFALVKVLPNGVFAPGWFLQALLVVLTAVAYGLTHGLALASLAATALITAAAFQRGGPAPVEFAVPVAGILMIGSVVGALLHRAMQGLFAAETAYRERLEQTLRALRRRERLLRHAMRVATIGETASMVVHQLRNKFQLVQGHVALGLLAEASEKDRRLRDIQVAVQSASGIVEQLLTLAHPKQGASHVVDLALECQSFADRVRPLLPPSIRLETEFSASVLLVNLSPEELGDALLNLVLNAKQAMRQGTIRIAAGCLGDAAAFVTVADDGPGIDERVRARMFTPFVTTKPRGLGTGLGLVAVDRFVRMAGGRIDVDTAPGRGTSFRLSFPKLAADAAEAVHARVG